MLAVEKALESENLSELKNANVALDQGTQTLADFLMDLAMEEQLRKKGLLDDAPASESPAPVLSGQPIAPTGTEGTLPVKGA
jgi:hypothetical protein